MIEKIEMSGKGYKIDEPFKKYVQKRLGNWTGICHEEPKKT